MPTVETNRCLRCGTVLAEGTINGLGRVCAACVLASAVQGLTPDADPAQAPRPLVVPRQIGDYDMVREIARGGMGVVWLAVQRSLGRQVAIKLLPPDLAIDPTRLTRFRAESKFAARLQHPNIVAIHEVGEHEDMPYYTMDYVPGQDLGTYARERPMAPRQAAELVRTIALAVQYAHDLGVLHRDLKPSNVLLTPGGEPRITDFGLARHVEEEIHLTQTGELLGSPCFMAPEQVAGRSRSLGVWTDVYGLGGLLHYALTGRPPFHANTISATLQLVLTADPPRLRDLAPEVSADLEGIVLRCLAKDPAHRLSSARQVATELERVLRGQPLNTRAPGCLERSWRWGRREPGVALLSVLSLGLLFLMIASWLHLEYGRERSARQQAAFRHELQLNRYISDVNQAAHALAEGNPRGALRLLDGVVPAADQPDPRGFEWYMLRQQCTGPGSLPVWQGPEPILDGAFSADQRFLLFVTDTHLRKVPAGGGLLLSEHRLPKRAEHRQVLAVPDGTEAWIGDSHGLYAVQLASGGIRTLVAEPVVRMVAEPWGSLVAVELAAPRQTSRIEVWDLVRARPVAALVEPAGEQLRWVAPGRLAGRGSDQVDWQWTVGSAGPERAPGPAEPVAPQELARSADGRRILTFASTGELRLEDRLLGQVEREEKVGPPGSVRFFVSPDGDRLVQAGPDAKQLMLRMGPEWKVCGVLSGHDQPVTQVRFLPASQGFLTMSKDGSLRRWTWEGIESSPFWREVPGMKGLADAVFSVDGRWLSVVRETAAGPESLLWKASALEDAPIRLLGRTVQFGPEGGHLLQWMPDGRLELWGAGGRGLHGSARVNPSPAGHPDSLSRDGGFLACLGRDGHLRLYHGVTGQELPGPVAQIRQHRISPTGRWILFGTTAGTGLYEVGKGEQFHIASRTPTSLAFSPDGRYAVAGYESGHLAIYDVEARALVLDHLVQPRPVVALAFLSDGRSLVTAASEGVLRFLNVPLWREVGRLQVDSGLRSITAQPGHLALLVTGEKGMQLLSVNSTLSSGPIPVVEGGFWEDPDRGMKQMSAGQPRAPLPMETMLR